MADAITVRATLTGLTIKPGKEPGDDPIVTMTLSPGYEDDLRALMGRVGQAVDIKVQFLQASLPMSIGSQR